MPKQPEKPDPLAREVDRLLRQLPGADPTLQSDPDQPPPRPQKPVATGPRPPVPPPRPTGPTAWQKVGVWGRAVAAVGLGAALTQWPYRADCEWPLYGYLAAVFSVLLTAGWAAVAAWRLRNPAAHVLALLAGFWGIVLAAEEILPRVGYAEEVRAWQCAAPAPRLPSAVPAPISSADSSAARDSMPGDSGMTAPVPPPNR